MSIRQWKINDEKKKKELNFIVRLFIVISLILQLFFFSIYNKRLSITPTNKINTFLNVTISKLRLISLK